MVTFVVPPRTFSTRAPKAVTKSHRGWEFSSVTMSVSTSYFHKEQKENRTKLKYFLAVQFPSYYLHIPSKILAVALGTTWIEISLCKPNLKLFCCLGSSSLHETTPTYIVSRILLSQVHSVLKSLFWIQWCKYTFYLYKKIANGMKWHL